MNAKNPDKRRTALRIGVSVAAAALLIGLIIWQSRSDSTSGSTLSAGRPAATDSPDDSATVPESEDTRLAAPDGPPEDAADLCPPTNGGATPPGCRITATLQSPKIARRSPSGPTNGLPDELAARRPSSLGSPALQDAADPFVLVDGLTYFVFSTSAEFLNVPVAVVPGESLVPAGGGSPGFRIDEAGVRRNPEGRIQRIDAMPQRPAWATDSGIWAPTVAQLEGRYVMYFAAKRPNPPEPVNAECVGRAFSSRPEGPYAPEPAPFTCGLGGIHGSLDPSYFRDPRGPGYLLIASGGTSTPLWSIPLDDGGGAAGAPKPLLRMQQPWESWFLENPSMVADGSDYILAYSAGDWRLGSYSTGVARCSSPVGPCRSTKAGPWLTTTGGVSGPGGLSFFRDIYGDLMAAHHGYPAGGEALFGARSTFVRGVKLDRSGIALR